MQEAARAGMIVRRHFFHPRLPSVVFATSVETGVTRLHFRLFLQKSKVRAPSGEPLRLAKHDGATLLR
jgi:hypothetical protein